jgi:beta-N-acetylhexosaminidase
MVLLCNQSVPAGGAAVDELLEGLDKARRQAKWRPSEASEQRRIDLLPQRPAASWDALMAQPQYIHALGLIP